MKRYQILVVNSGQLLLNFKLKYLLNQLFIPWSPWILGSTDISDLSWSRKIWSPSWLFCTWRLLFCHPSFYCLPTRAPTHPLRFSQKETLEHIGSSMHQLWVSPSGVHWHTVQLVAGFRNWKILVLVWIISQCNRRAEVYEMWYIFFFCVGCSLVLIWGGIRQPLPPFVCLPPPVNSIDQRRGWFCSPDHRSSKEALARPAR